MVSLESNGNSMGIITMTSPTIPTKYLKAALSPSGLPPRARHRPLARIAAQKGAAEGGGDDLGGEVEVVPEVLGALVGEVPAVPEVPGVCGTSGWSGP